MNVVRWTNFVDTRHAYELAQTPPILKLTMHKYISTDAYTHISCMLIPYINPTSSRLSFCCFLNKTTHCGFNVNLNLAKLNCVIRTKVKNSSITGITNRKFVSGYKICFIIASSTHSAKF